MILKNENISSESLGFVETKSYVGLIEASDAMVKAANVQLINSFRIGSALVTVVVKGDLASCLSAVEAGKSAAMKVGELVTANVIARPFEDTNYLVDDLISKDKGNTKSVKKTDNDKFKPEVSGQTESLELLIIESIKKSDGLNISEISHETQTDRSEVRIILKKLINENKIEKVGPKYFTKK